MRFLKACILFVTVILGTSVTSVWAENSLSISNIETKKFESEFEGVITVSVRADVTNTTSKAVKAEVYIQALDKDNFEVKNWLLKGTISAKETKQLSSSEEVDSDSYAKIVKWQVEQ